MLFKGLQLVCLIAIMLELGCLWAFVEVEEDDLEKDEELKSKFSKVTTHTLDSIPIRDQSYKHSTISNYDTSIVRTMSY